MSIRIRGRDQSALLIISILGRVAISVRLGEPVALPVVSILSDIPQRIGVGHQIFVVIVVIANGIPATIGKGSYISLSIISVGTVVSVAILDPDRHPVFVILKFFCGAIWISSTRDVAIFVVLIGSRISFTVCPTGNLIQIVISDLFFAAGISAFSDAALFVKPDLVDITVRSGTDIVAAIKVVSKLKGAKVCRVLMNDSPSTIIFIFYINLAIEILDGTQITTIIFI